MNIKKISLILAISFGINCASLISNNFNNGLKVAAQTNLEIKKVQEYGAEYFKFSVKYDDHNKNQVIMTLDKELNNGDKISKVSLANQYFQSPNNEKFNGEIKININGNRIVFDNIYLKGVYTFDITITRANNKQETYRVSFEKIGTEGSFKINVAVDNSKMKIMNPMIDGKEIKSGIFNLYDVSTGGTPIESLDFSYGNEFNIKNLAMGKTYYIGFKNDINSNEYVMRFPVHFLGKDSQSSQYKVDIVYPTLTITEVKMDNSVMGEINFSDKFSIRDLNFEEFEFGGVKLSSKDITLSEGSTKHSVKFLVKNAKKTNKNGIEGYDYKFKVKETSSTKRVADFEGFLANSLKLNPFLPIDNGWFARLNNGDFLYNTNFIKNDYVADISSSDNFDKSISLSKPTDKIVKVKDFKNDSIYSIKVQPKGSNLVYFSSMKFKDSINDGITSGDSTGNVSLELNKNNTKYGSCSMTVTLPSGLTVDTSKKPVLLGINYTDKNGKLIKEDKEQFANVITKFDGNKLVIEGLVPEKKYQEIFINYTEKDGSIKTIVLKNVQIPSTTQLQRYIDNFYNVVFLRSADETGYHFHLDQLKNKKISLRKFLLNMLAEKEFIEIYKTTESKIEALYNGIFFRTSDWEGKMFWINEYKKAVKLYGSESEALQRTAERIINEKEMKELAEQMDLLW